MATKKKVTEEVKAVEAKAEKVATKVKATAKKVAADVKAEEKKVAAKAKAVEKKVATKKPAAKKPAEKKPVAKKPVAKKAPKNEVIIQSPMGGVITPAEVLAKVGPVDQVYVRVDENKAYWVKGDENGAVDLW